MAVTNFIPELWSARLLQGLEKSHVAANLVNRDYEGEIKNQGDKVYINTLSDVTIKTYTANSDIASPDDLTTTKQYLEITEADYFNIQLDDVDRVQVAGELMDTAMKNVAYKMNDTTDSFILGKIAAGVDNGNIIGSTANPVQVSSNNIYTNIIAMRTKLDKANVPTSGRSIVIPPEIYALLLQDDRFVKSDAQAGQNALLNGFVGRVAGFDVFESNNVVYQAAGGTQDDPTPAYWKVTAQVRTATTFAEQIVKTEAYRMEKRFSDAVKGLHVYGAKVTDGTQIAELICNI